MKTIQFTLEIGNQTPDALTADLKIYGISENNQYEVGSFTMSKPSESFTFSDDDFIYYFAVASIQSFSLNKTSYTNSDLGNVDFLSVFSRNEAEILMNERATLANAFCFTQSMIVSNNGEITLTASDRVLGLSMGMRNNFISSNGELSSVIQNSPNGLQTNSFPLWNSLGNLTFACLINPSVCSKFIEYVHNQSDAQTFLAALYTIIRNPFTAVDEIYGLIEKNLPVFRPSLIGLSLPEGHSRKPNQWTLAIKIHNSGANNYLIGGPAFIVFDKNDRGWMTNNVVQGTPNSASYCMVFEPNGEPAEFSPVFGGGLIGTGFGVATDPKGENIYFGSFGWGPTQCNPQQGAIAQFSADGTTISPPNGYVEGLSRVQGLNFDGDGNLWVTSWGSQAPFAPADTLYPYEDQDSAVVVYLVDAETGKLNFEKPLTYKLGNPYRATFDVAYNPVAKAMYLTCGGTGKKQDSLKIGMSGVYKFVLENGEITCKAKWDANPLNDPKSENVDFFEGLKQVNFDSEGFVYVGAIRTGHSRIVKLDQNLVYQSELTSNIDRPWSVTIDKNDTIFAGNFGREFEPMPDGIKDLPFGTTGVTVFKRQGDQYPEGNLMTLPTGGEEVMLANGFPLYGVIKVVEYYFVQGRPTGIPIMPACYTPLMRITSSSIDGAGNLWVINNWKPSAANDLLLNPGGDGIVIFVGVAAPEPYKFG